MSRTRDPELERIGALVQGIGIGMLATRARDGHWVSRPVEPRMIDGRFDGDLWILTSASSHKVAEIKAHPRINLSMASPRDNRYVSVSGRAVVRRDRARIARLWTARQRVYYPGGPEDPDLTLVRVRVDTVEYWDGPASWLGRAFRFALAATVRNADAMGDNRTVSVQPGKRSARVVRGNARGDAGRVQRSAAPARKR